jgi:hypothetical protein
VTGLIVKAHGKRLGSILAHFRGWRFAVQDDGRQPARSVDTLRGYVRDADAFRDHAGARLL